MVYLVKINCWKLGNMQGDSSMNGNLDIYRVEVSIRNDK